MVAPNVEFNISTTLLWVERDDGSWTSIVAAVLYSLRLWLPLAPVSLYNLLDLFQRCLFLLWSFAVL